MYLSSTQDSLTYLNGKTNVFRQACCSFFLDRPPEKPYDCLIGGIMDIYYIDYENVNSQGLAGVELLGPDCQVNILYSKKADNIKIDVLTAMMKSSADIHFIPVHVGTPNALDFQLVTLLFLNYRSENNHFIISKDSGYDCCIRTAAENDASHVRRFRDIETAVRYMSSRNPSPVPPAAEEPTLDAGDSLAEESAPPLDSAPKQDAGTAPLPDAGLSLPLDFIDVPSPVSVPAHDDSDSTHQAQDDTDSTYQGQNDTDSAHQTQDDTDSAHQAQESEAVPSVSPSRRRGRRRKSKASSAGKAAEEIRNQPAEGSYQPSGHLQDDSDREQKSQPAAPSAAEGRDSLYPYGRIAETIQKRCGMLPDQEKMKVIREALISAKNKQQFYSSIVRSCGQKEGLELYHTIRCAYNDLVSIEPGHEQKE